MTLTLHCWELYTRKRRQRRRLKIDDSIQRLIHRLWMRQGPCQEPLPSLREKQDHRFCEQRLGHIRMMQLPAYDPIDPRYYDEKDLRTEVERIFSWCADCRLCNKFCGSFPKMFEAVDGYCTDEKYAEVDLKKFTVEDVKTVVNLCFQCKLCDIMRLAFEDGADRLEAFPWEYLYRDQDPGNRPHAGENRCRWRSRPGSSSSELFARRGRRRRTPPLPTSTFHLASCARQRWGRSALCVVSMDVRRLGSPMG